MAPLLTLITYLVAAALAVGYACETGLPSWRRAVAPVLGLSLAASAGQLLTSANPMIAYVVGIPSLLALGAIMIAPERKAPPAATPNRRASDRARPAQRTARWQFDRRASGRRTPAPVHTDTNVARVPNAVTEITSMPRPAQVTHAPAAARTSGRTAGGRERVADAVLAARRQHGRRAAPRSLSRISRCRYR